MGKENKLKDSMDAAFDYVGGVAKSTGKKASQLGSQAIDKANELKNSVSNDLMTEENIMNLLDDCYRKSLDGIPMVSKSIEELANEYLEKYSTPEKACKAMIKNQVYKCTTSGFITGFGGFITMPVTIPANVGSVIYVQMRMIACSAYMAGLDLKGDHVQTLVYACLAGVAVNDVIKVAGAKFAIKFGTNLVKKIPGETLVKINQKVGFRFLTKFGEKGIINLGKAVPVLGAVVGGSLDLVETKVIGNRSYKWFFKNDFSVKKQEEIDEEIDDIIEQE
jgi:hypothetical protein